MRRISLHATPYFAVCLRTDVVGLKTHIKEILGRCLTILSDLKEQVTNLAQFFRNMSLMIGDVTTNQVDRFVDYLNRNTGDGPSIGGFTFTDLQHHLQHRLHSRHLKLRSARSY
jgi:hypothetical protein